MTVKLTVAPALLVWLTGWVVMGGLAAICSGRLVEMKVPSPSWPKPLVPIAHKLPSLLRNRLKLPPAAIAVTLLASNLFRSVSGIKSAIAQLARIICAHRPQAAIILKKQAVV